MPDYKLICTLSDGTVINAGTIKIPDSTGDSSGSGGSGGTGTTEITGYQYMSGSNFCNLPVSVGYTFYNLVEELSQGEIDLPHAIVITDIGYSDRPYITLLFTYNEYESTGYPGVLLTVDLRDAFDSNIEFIAECFDAFGYDFSSIAQCETAAEFIETCTVDILSEMIGRNLLDYVKPDEDSGKKLANMIMLSLFAGDGKVQVSEKSNIKVSLGLTMPTSDTISYRDTEEIRDILRESEGYDVPLLYVLNMSNRCVVAYIERTFVE